MSTLRDRVVDVMGKKYKIRFLRDAYFEESECGVIEFDKMEILINSEKGTPHQKDTILHEIVHAIDRDLDLHLNENQVRHLSCGLYQTLKANKRLRGWLFSERKKLNE
jgi:Zn-dependent peptidase ImmA (M78 family)